MRRKIGYTSDRIALYLNIGGHHLADQGRQPPEGDDQDLVLSCTELATVWEAGEEMDDGDGDQPFTARLPSAALAAR